MKTFHSYTRRGRHCRCNPPHLTPEAVAPCLRQRGGRVVVEDGRLYGREIRPREQRRIDAALEALR